MRAIQVKYLPATAYRPSRWKAFAYGGLSATIPYEFSGDEEENVRKAAQLLIDRMGWKSTISGCGTLPNGDYVVTLGGM